MTDITDARLVEWAGECGAAEISEPGWATIWQFTITDLRRFAELARSDLWGDGNTYMRTDDAFNLMELARQEERRRIGLTLASPELAGDMAELKRRIKEEPGFGASLLREAGIINERGELAERFGGARGSDK